MEQDSIHIDRNDSTMEPPGAGAVVPDRKMAQMAGAVKKNLSRQIQFMLNSCVNCGLCAQSCHCYCATGDSELIPANKFKKLSRILQTHFHPLKSRLPFLIKHDEPDEQMIIELYRAAYENCTLCGKCALTCPMGINTGEFLYLARAMLAAVDRLPTGLKNPVETFFKVGNYLGLSTDDFIGTIKWFAEEMSDEIGEENFSIPIDKKKAEQIRQTGAKVVVQLLQLHDSDP